MSGICGVMFNERNRDVPPDCMDTMLRAIDMTGSGERKIVHNGRIAIGVVGFPGRISDVAEIAVNGRPLILVLQGSPYNVKEVIFSDEISSDPAKRIVEIYAREGLDIIWRLRGDFTIAIWDGREEKLLLVSDAFRIHPLFYFYDSEKLVFASRMQALSACSLIGDLSVNPSAIVHVVGSSIIPSPESIYMEVKKLPSSHYLSCKGGVMTIKPCWDVSFIQTVRENERALASEFKERFYEVITLCRNVDEESRKSIGTFLSGGVDSSTVTGVLAQSLKQPVKSFSIGFDEERFNEIHYARIAAKAFASEHYEYFVTPTDTFEAIPVLIESFDEPYANASAIPAYFCGKMAKEHGVDTLYAGDGGDELFAGNERYATQRLFDYYNDIPAAIRKHFVTPLIYWMSDILTLGLLTKGRKYIQRAAIPYPERITSYDFFRVVSMVDFCTDDLLAAVGRDFDPYAIVSSYYFSAPAKTNLERHLFVDWKLTLTDNDLIKITRMTEAAGVNVRYPFLDYEIVKLSTRIPADIKMKGLRLRTFQKKTYSDLLPRDVIDKKKHGFGLPLPLWLRKDKRLNDMMHDLVLSDRSIQRGYFRKQSLEKLVEEHKTDETSFTGTVLWNLMVLELWHRRYIDR